MTVSLKRAPGNNDKHLWADYFELVCLLSEEGHLSRGDIEEHADQLADTETDVLGADAGADPSAAELVDGRKVVVSDLFAHLKYRQGAFGTAYPFRLTAGDRALERAPVDPEAHGGRFLYMLLLVASALEHLQPNESNAVAAAFEAVAFDVIRSWMPAPAQVRHFGTRPSGRQGFTGNLKNKVASLAEALNEEAPDRPGLYRDPNVGDGGLDVVAWFPFDDEVRAAPSVFVQATCQNDWSDKPGELRYDKWKQRLTLLVQPPSVLVIPYCFRSPDGEWYLESDITCVTIDRQRILGLIGTEAVELDDQVVSLVNRFWAPAREAA